MSWPTASLRELTTKIGSGATPRGGSKVYKPEGTPIIRSMNVHDGRFEPTGLAFIDDVQAAGLSNVVLKAGDVLLNITGASVARCCRLPSELSGGRVNQHVAIVRPDPDHLNSDYLEHLLVSPDTKAKLLGIAGGGATREAITKSAIENFEIPLPPLEEQKRIAGILDQAAELCRLRTRALDKLNTLGQAIFHEMFGNPIVESALAPTQALGELLNAIDSGKSPKCLDRPAHEAEAGILKLSAVTSGSFMPEENKGYDGSVPLDPRHRIHDGDLLFTRKNTMALVAAVALVRGVGDRQLYMPDLIFRLRLKTDAPIRPQYLRHVLGHPAKRAQIQALAGGAAGSMPNISKAKLINVAIPVPPMDAQIAFEARLAQCESNEGTAESSLDKAQTLFASLQHRAFQGEL